MKKFQVSLMHEYIFWIKDIGKYHVSYEVNLYDTLNFRIVKTINHYHHFGIILRDKAKISH